MRQDQQLRDQLSKLMRCGQAFTSLQEVLGDIQAADAGKTVKNLPYTLWQIIEHMRIALYDILEFSRDPGYKSPTWPDGYWPEEYAPANQAALEASVQKIRAGVETMVTMVQDPANDLFEPFAHGNGQNLLREAMLVAEHNAYHLGEIVLFRRLLGKWK
ncbi:DinB family protein [Pontibacter sp. 13R65]|uniref:DinB family protein n=1 Tax=Pontibacter sp. 13R65 TaxID=3127458 RepID=UPI00301DA535